MDDVAPASSSVATVAFLLSRLSRIDNAPLLSRHDSSHMLRNSYLQVMDERARRLPHGHEPAPFSRVSPSRPPPAGVSYIGPSTLTGVQDGTAPPSLARERILTRTVSPAALAERAGGSECSAISQTEEGRSWTALRPLRHSQSGPTQSGHRRVVS